MLNLIARNLLGKGIDKKFPYLVTTYKKVYPLVTKKKDILLTLKNDITLYVSSHDTGLGMYLRTKGEFEPLQTKLFLQSIKPNMTIFDIGANVGYYTILASKAVGKRGKVYAFEPDSQNLRLLNKNIFLNNCTNVVIVPHAVTSYNGSAVFTSDTANPGEGSLLATKKGLKKSIQVITLDSFMRKHKVRKVDVIKMDIEGSEVEALIGSKSLTSIKNIKLFIECNTRALHAFGTSDKNLIKKLKDFGFSIKKIINEHVQIISSFSKKNIDKSLKNATYVTLVAIK